MFRIITCVICVFVFLCGSAMVPALLKAQTIRGAKTFNRFGSSKSNEGVAIPSAPPTDLFFSEYLEGTNSNKAIEIFNGTGGPVDLGAGAYRIDIYANGSTSPTGTKTLNGVVANGDVYVVAHSSANLPIQTQADDVTTIFTFTGDDAVVLLKGSTVIDVIGQIGNDPGTEWGTGVNSTADNTLVRKPDVCGGDTNGSNTFDPAAEWDGFAVDTSSGLGSHTANCSVTIPNLSINDVSQSEGHSGLTDYTFTVSLSSPAGAGGVTFDIATADGTAQDATPDAEDDDYTVNSLTGQTIPQGSTTYLFTVPVKGDMLFEPNETFFVNVTNVTGAAVTDGQGQGTVVNDDLAPTAAPVSITGRVLTSDGRGISGASVSLTDSLGVAYQARTNSFGYYRFEEVRGGESYILTVAAKRLKFSPQIVNADADITGLNIYPEM
jgi:uncharacterized protein